MKRLKGRVRWNEANLSEIEANKVVRKKIDEPKTPYHPMIEEDGFPSATPGTAKTIDYAAHAEALRNALSKVAPSQKHFSPFGAWASSGEEGETGEKDQGFAKQRDDASFTESRRAHYDEFKKVKELQQELCFLNDEHNKGIHNSGSCSSLSIKAREIHIEDSDEILRIIDIEEY
ncbi:hypothetical protein SCA6_005274 [Theobroma cacao]